MSTAGKEGSDSGASGLFFGTPDARDRTPCKAIAAYTAVFFTIFASLLLFGGSYRYNVHLKRQLAGDCRDNSDLAQNSQRTALSGSWLRAAICRRYSQLATLHVGIWDEKELLGKDNASGKVHLPV